MVLHACIQEAQQGHPGQWLRTESKPQVWLSILPRRTQGGLVLPPAPLQGAQLARGGKVQMCPPSP